MHIITLQNFNDRLISTECDYEFQRHQFSTTYDSRWCAMSVVVGVVITLDILIILLNILMAIHLKKVPISEHLLLHTPMQKLIAKFSHIRT